MWCNFLHKNLLQKFNSDPKKTSSFQDSVNQWHIQQISDLAQDCTGFYTKARPLVKSNLICPSDKLGWQPGCPVLKYQ